MFEDFRDARANSVGDESIDADLKMDDAVIEFEANDDNKFEEYDDCQKSSSAQCVEDVVQDEGMDDVSDASETEHSNGTMGPMVRYIGVTTRRNGQVLAAGSIGTVMEFDAGHAGVRFPPPVGSARINVALLDHHEGWSTLQVQADVQEAS